MAEGWRQWINRPRGIAFKLGRFDAKTSNGGLLEAAAGAHGDIRAMSAALTTQVLALIAPLTALILGFAAIERQPGTVADWAEIAAISAISAGLASVAFALRLVHDRLLWTANTDDEVRAFVMKEANRLAAKGWWCRIGAWATLASAVSVFVCGIDAFGG